MANNIGGGDVSLKVTPGPELLAEERRRASFDVKALTELIDGSPEFARAKEITATLLERDPILNAKNPYDMTRPEERQLTMAQIRRCVAIKKQLKEPLLIKAFDHWLNRLSRALSMRIYVHETLFRESIFTHGTPEQWNAWRDDVENWRVIGCFSMTELGHSSFLRGLETTATYDKNSQEFIIHTPALTGTKWWIGMAGQVATHTVALCKLIIDNQEYGVHWFIVPLRSREDGTLLPGVTAGDVGAKIARNGLDNGWIQFTNVRIPRENMLMKWAQVSSEGRFTAPPNPALSYNTLIGERLVAVGGVAEILTTALTVAVRYGAVRQQGPNNEQILDFQSHQWALMPILGSAFAFGVVYSEVMKHWEENLASQNKNPEGFLSSLGDWHAIAAGLKAWGGWWGADSLEAIRRTMGGHAYSAYASIGSLIAEYAVITTGGGDNIVLAQQSTRQLLNSLKRALTGKKVSGSVAFFADMDNILRQNRFKPKNSKEVDSDPEAILAAFRWLCLTVLSQTATKLSEYAGNGEKLEQVWNDIMMEAIVASRLHTQLFILEVFGNFINSKTSTTGPREVAVLRKLWSVYALNLLMKESSLFLEHGYYDGAQAAAIRTRFSTVCKDLRKDAVALVDTFNIPDFVLKTPFGRYDGDIYNYYFRTVLEAPNALGVPSYFEKEIAPLTRTKAKL